MDAPPTRGRERGTGRLIRQMLQGQESTGEGSTQLLLQASMLEASENLAGRHGREPETLEELLLGTHKDEEDSSKLGSTARGATNLTRWHTQIERNPDLYVELFNAQVIRALGADVTGAPWSVQQYTVLYTVSKIQFKRLLNTSDPQGAMSLGFTFAAVGNRRAACAITYRQESAGLAMQAFAELCDSQHWQKNA
eukprot:6490083-Amphidinium_carterae.1